MNDDDACGVMEAQYIRRHHRHDPNDTQCTSAVFKNVRAPVPLVRFSFFFHPSDRELLFLFSFCSAL